MRKVLRRILKKINSIEKRLAGLESAIRDRQVTELSFGISDGSGDNLVKKHSEDRNIGCGRTVPNRNVF